MFVDSLFVYWIFDYGYYYFPTTRQKGYNVEEDNLGLSIFKIICNSSFTLLKNQKMRKKLTCKVACYVSLISQKVWRFKS